LLGTRPLSAVCYSPFHGSLDIGIHNLVRFVDTDLRFSGSSQFVRSDAVFRLDVRDFMRNRMDMGGFSAVPLKPYRV